MQRVLAICLLGVLTWSSASYLFVFVIPRAQIRAEIKERLGGAYKEEDLVLVKIPLALERGASPVFQRFHDREFRYKGRMYDVARSEQHGDTTWYYCIFDEKETELYAELDDLIDEGRRSTPDQQNLLQYFAQSLHWFLVRSHPELRTYTRLCVLPAGAYYFSLQTWCDVPDPPPPQV